MNTTVSTSSARTPASTSTVGSDASSRTGSGPGRKPMPVSTRIVRPPLAISQAVWLIAIRPPSIRCSPYCAKAAGSASGKK